MGETGFGRPASRKGQIPTPPYRFSGCPLLIIRAGIRSAGGKLIMKIGQMLLNDHHISKEQLDEALRYHRDRHCMIGEALLDLEYIAEEVLERYLARQRQ